MTKKDLIDKVSVKSGCSKAYSKDIIDSVFGSITEELKAGNDVTIHNFGVFKPVTKAARTARNPRTGESISVPAKKTVKFKVTSGTI